MFYFFPFAVPRHHHSAGLLCQGVSRKSKGKTGPSGEGGGAGRGAGIWESTKLALEEGK